MTHQAQLNKWIKSHGFKTRIISEDYIEIEIPYTSAEGNGVEKHAVATINEAREVLGY